MRLKLYGRVEGKRAQVRWAVGTAFVRCDEVNSWCRSELVTITITKRGRPLAKVGPVKPTRWKSLEGMWAGRVEVDDDLLMADRSDLWDVVRQREGAKD
jgi:antitoxin (DNA-binding transcriptional repressor) of toxin-antitoxin stability system